MDSILNFDEYFDIELSNDDSNYDKNIINSTEIVKDGLGFWFDINNKNCFINIR